MSHTDAVHESLGQLLAALRRAPAVGYGQEGQAAAADAIAVVARAPGHDLAGVA